MAAALRAALIDVGGTLWPDGWHPAWDEGDPLREGGLRTALPASSSGRAAELLEGLKRTTAVTSKRSGPRTWSTVSSRPWMLASASRTW